LEVGEGMMGFAILDLRFAIGEVRISDLRFEIAEFQISDFRFQTGDLDF
jgi:hypothetical protein